MDNKGNSIRLSELKTGESCVIIRIHGSGRFRKRILEIGFVKGKVVKVIKNAPLQDPIEYQILGYHISLRRSESELIEVVPIVEASENTESEFNGTFAKETERTITEKSKTITIALVGNPNSGKTSLFNFASGSHERVGNYAGVTVDIKTAVMRHKGYIINITDLPGTYSIAGYTPEEKCVQQHLMNASPDMIVNVVDASNLNRNLFLTTQLIDMNTQVLVALNMYDELQDSGAKFAYHDLSKMIGIPIVPTVAKTGKGLSDLLDKIIDVFENSDPVVRHVHINYGEDIETAITQIQPELRLNDALCNRYSSRYLAIRLLENDLSVREIIEQQSNAVNILKVTEQQIERLKKKYNDTVETIMADAKYGFIAGALSETYVPGESEKQRLSTAIDTVITNKYLGIPILLFFLWLMFQTTFSLGQYPMDWIESGIAWLSGMVNNLMPEGALRSLLVDGVIGGIGGVAVFLPNILILFAFISLMEDSGYMARAAFIMDRLMHKIGLHGKSFIPLLMGFGCNVPAVMATRTLESRKDRLLTMLITPFMSCSARLAVFALFISAFFQRNQGLILFSVYMVGVAVAVISAILLKKTVFAKEEAPFVMELPPYRMPTVKNTSLHIWYKAREYIYKMGTIILFASILIWALNYFPHDSKMQAEYEARVVQVENNNQLTDDEKQLQIIELQVEEASIRQENSYIGQMGRFVEPIVRPLGFDWKMGVSIITGFAAKEVVVSSMGVLYHAEIGADENSTGLQERLQQQTYTNGSHAGEKVFSPLVAYSFMVFILLYFPCVAVLVAIRREGGWKWAVFSAFYNTAFAWLLSFLIYQIGSLL